LCKKLSASLRHRNERDCGVAHGKKSHDIEPFQILDVELHLPLCGEIGKNIHAG